MLHHPSVGPKGGKFARVRRPNRFAICQCLVAELFIRVSDTKNVRLNFAVFSGLAFGERQSS